MFLLMQRANTWENDQTLFPIICCGFQLHANMWSVQQAASQFRIVLGEGFILTILGTNTLNSTDVPLSNKKTNKLSDVKSVN